jgi:hypothetical protein
MTFSEKMKKKNPLKSEEELSISCGGERIEKHEREEYEPAPEKKKVTRIIMEMRNESAAGVEKMHRSMDEEQGTAGCLFLKSDALVQRMTTGNLHSVTWYMRRYYYLD